MSDASIRVTDWFIPQSVRESSPGYLRRARTTVVVCLMLVAATLIYVPAYTMLGPAHVGHAISIALCFADAMMCALLLAGRRRWGLHLGGVTVTLALVATLSLILAYTGGARAPATWWLVMTPLIVTTIVRRDVGVVSFFACGVYLSALAWLELDGVRPLGELSIRSVTLVEWIARLTLMTILFGIAVFYELANDKAIGDLASTNRALEIERVKAVAADRAKSEFLANMSHEIRTPMTAIVGFAEILAERGDPDRERAEGLEVIRSNGQHLLELINDILDLSKVEAGRLTLERLSCSPAALIREVATLMRPKVIARGLTMRVEYRTAIPEHFDTDPSRLRQLLINLLGNAVKFTERGSVSIRTTLLDTAGQGSLEIEVVDTGIGMTHEQLERAFDPFTQADASTSRRYGGSGLGLAICSRLAELLGASLDAESTPGVGSTFRLVLPIGPLAGMRRITQDSALLQMEPGNPADTGRRPALDESDVEALDPPVRVLLAEDGQDNRRLITARLRRIAAQLECVENGALAVERAREAMSRGSPYEVILMDMSMPIMDGYAAAAALRASGYTGHIVALTAHAMSGDRERCISAGCDEFLTKPIDVPTLLSTVLGAARRAREKS